MDRIPALHGTEDVVMMPIALQGIPSIIAVHGEDRMARGPCECRGGKCEIAGFVAS
jgi:hypothetical protein